MKILVLHGYGQTVEILQKRAGKLFQRLQQDGHQLVFPEAVTPVQLFDTAGEVRQEGRAWFTLHPEDPNDATALSTSEPTEWLGLEQSLVSLQELEFDAIIGFSQGAAVRACCAMSTPLQCCIFFSGFLSPPPTNWELTKITCPVLTFHDPNDPILPPTAAKSISQVCSDSHQVIHTKKHSIPIQKQYLDLICNFLDSQMNK